MDPRLIEYYNRELQHLRETGAEFARDFPKIAARLGMEGLEVADPYVERLLEGVAFLAGRVQLKIDAEFPRFTQSLLEMVHPHYLAPTPSMLVAQVTPKDGEDLRKGPTVPRDSRLLGRANTDDGGECEFRTAHDVRLWPIAITAASYFAYAPDLQLTGLPIASRIKAGVRIRLKAREGVSFAHLPLDRLTLYLSGPDEVANRLLESCLANALGSFIVPRRGASAADVRLQPASSIRAVGFDDGQALLPVTIRSFHGYRLLQEYFAFPQRFRFVEITGLDAGLSQAAGDEIELVLLFSRHDPALERAVDASTLALFCTPAVNLFRKIADRINVRESSHEYHVVPERTRPLDFEVYRVTAVTGHGAGTDVKQPFLPFYAADASTARHSEEAYFTTRREPRLISSAQKRYGPRTTYIGTEVFLSLVDPQAAPFTRALRQLSIETTCTNRDLAMLMPQRAELRLDVAAPVDVIRVIGGPSRPGAPLADGPVAWRAISQLSLNYLSLVNTTAEQGAAALRDLLELYVPGADPAARRQIEGIRSVRVAPIVRRLPGRGQIAFGRGMAITLDVDELAFEGASAFLAGAVLERFFARHASINSFTETVLRSANRGEIARWTPQWGTRPTL